MIKVEKGKVEIRDVDTMELHAELAVAVNAVRKALEEEMGKELADKMTKRAVEVGMMSDEEMERESRKLAMKFFERIFGGGGSKGSVTEE